MILYYLKPRQGEKLYKRSCLGYILVSFNKLFRMDRSQILALVGEGFTRVELNVILNGGQRKVRFVRLHRLTVSREERKHLRVTHLPLQGAINTFRFAIDEIPSFKKASVEGGLDRLEKQSEDDLLRSCFHPK